jgi:NodT family efflux transporter outer membrane factor (OMF) lipoprotein
MGQQVMGEKFAGPSGEAVQHAHCKKPRAAVVASLGLALSLAASGCAVGPDFNGPPVPLVENYLPAKLEKAARKAGARPAPGAHIPGEWWEVFGSQKLNGLIAQGLAQNQDIAAAEAALRVAKANLGAARGAFFPTIQASWESNRQLTPTQTLSSNAANGAAIYSLHTAQATVTYVADVFGAVRRTVESADALTEAQYFQLEAAALTVSSSIALAAVQQASFQGQIDVTRNLIKTQTDLLGILRRQYAAGQIALPDVLVQETALAQTKLLLPPLERQREQQADAIAVLTGQFPGQAERPNFTLQSFRSPRQVPVSVPADLVRQRPDVRVAEANLRSANALIGVAIANRLPQITLTGNGGSTADMISRLFSPGTWFWMIAGTAVQTVFDGRTLEMKQRAAEAAFDQQTAQYKSVVLQGVQNVADTLLALEADTRAVAAAREAEEAAKKSLDLVRTQLDQGQIALPTVITAQQAYLQTSLASVQARAARLADTIALYQALGGGWWNRVPVEEVEAAHHLRGHFLRGIVAHQ